MDTQNDTAPDRGSGSSSYPQGCTDNGLLMRGLQRLTAAGKPQAFVLYTALAVRAMGKWHCWPKDKRLMRRHPRPAEDDPAVARGPRNRRAHHHAGQGCGWRILRTHRHFRPESRHIWRDG